MDEKFTNDELNSHFDIYEQWRQHHLTVTANLLELQNTIPHQTRNKGLDSEIFDETKEILKESEVSIKQKIKIPTKSEILEMISNDIVKTFNIYEISEDFIFENIDVIEKDNLIKLLKSSSFVLSEKFIENAINVQYFTKEDLYDLPMTNYAQFSEEFIEKYEDDINWVRMFIYKITDDNIDPTTHIRLVEKYDLWNLLSMCELPQEFLLKYKDKLNLNYVKLVNKLEEDFFFR